MKDISHKQAVRLIHLRLDGLLNESQRHSMNEHLVSCDSCRDYAAEMDALSVHLQNEFRVRWDQNAGPSHSVFEHVTTRARKIPMTNRISAGIRLMASGFFVALLILGINFMILQMKNNPIATIGTQSVSGSELSDNRLIAFTSEQGGNAEIYTVYPDGSHQTNLTNNLSKDSNPIWSPDGKLIAFESDRTGFIQIYTMNPDGSNLTQITNEEADYALGTKYGNMPDPWSPDGKKIIFSQTVRGDANNMLYVMEADGRNKIALTGEPGLYTFLGWSPDGQKIVYQISNASDNGDTRIMVASVDGTSTFDGPFFEGDGGRTHHQIHWKTSEQFITLSSNSERPTWGLWNLTSFYTTEDAYINYIGSNPILVTSNSPIVAIFDRTYVVENQDSLSWFVYSGAPIPLAPWSFSDLCKTPTDPLVAETFHTISPDKQRDFVTLICPERTTYFFLMNSDGTDIQQLDASIAGQSQVNALTWSPDGQHVIVTTSTDSSTNSTNLFRFDVQEMLNDPSVKPVQLTTDDVWKYGVVWQPIASNEVAVKEPTPESTKTASQNGLIAFVSNGTGDEEIYTTKSDGTDLKNITQNPASDTSAVWSPDGKRIAFESNRDGSTDIYVMDFDGSNVTRLTSDSVQDTHPVWSPDGTKIAYASGDSDKNNTNIYVMDANGQNPRRLTNYVPNTIVWPEAWSPDGQFIFFEVYRQIVKVNVNDGEIKPITPQSDENVPSNFVLSKDSFTLAYLATCSPDEAGADTFCTLVKSIQVNGENDEIRTTLKAPEICPIKQTASWMGEFIKWSPDQTKLLLAFTCEDNGWLYVANGDGSDFKPLTNAPVFGNMPDNEVATFDWSPDSQSIVFTSALDKAQNLYTLNINYALQNPDIRPIPLNASAAQVSSPAWQPILNDEVVEEKSTQTSSSDRLLAFTSNQDGNTEIYTIRADGSGLNNITNNSASDVNPAWSPDGTRIAFGSDRDGGDYSQIFLMDADGSNITQLTTDDGDHLLPLMLNGKTSLWSPDGSKLLYMRIGFSDTEWTLQSIDINNGGITSLGTGKVDINHISWSPDGKHIAFIRNDPKNTDDNKFVPQIQVVSADGTNLTTINSLLPADEALNVPINYYWSRDGQSIFFIASNMAPENTASENYTWKVYEASMDGTLTLHTTTRTPIGGWWDGNYFITPIMGPAGWTWVHPDGSVNTINPTKECEQERLYDAGTNSYTSAVANFIQSPNGNGLIIASCPDGNVHLSWVNSTGTKVTPVAKLPKTSLGGYGDFEWASWSQDDRFIAFHPYTPSPTDGYIHILSIADALKDPSIPPVKIPLGKGEFILPLDWQPVSNHKVVEEEPTPEPTQTSSSNSLIAFTADNNDAANINTDIYTIRYDGSNLTNLTHDPAKDFNADDYNPAWSPDRRKLAFMSERGGNMTGNANIFVMNRDRNELTQLTYHPGNDAFLSWSPNGERIVYYASPNGENNSKGQLIVMNADGSDKTVLTTLGYYSFRNWSPDSQKIVYVKSEFDGASYKGAGIYVVDIDGKNRLEWIADKINQIHWQDSTHFLGVGVVQAGENARATWSLYQFNTDGSQIELTSHRTPIIAIFERSYVVEGQNGLTWFALEGTPISLSPWNVAEKCETTGDSYVSTSLSISPDQKRALVIIYCKDATWHYLVNEDGSEINQLGAPMDGSFAILPHWLPDGQYVSLFVIDYEEDLYLVDIQKMLNDPSATPILLATNVLAGVLYAEPLTESNDNEEKPTPEPPAFSLSVYAAEKVAFFDVLEPSYLPAGFALEGVAYNPWTQQVAMKYISQQGNGSLLIYQQRGDLLHYPSLRVSTTSVPIGDKEGEFIRGAWIYESPDTTTPTWDPRADSYGLSWQQGEFVFSIHFIGGETITPLPVNEFVAIAESLK